MMSAFSKPSSQVSSRAAGLACALLAALALAGCSGLPDKPTRATMYDFGPGPLATLPTTRQAPLPAIALDDISTSGGALDNMAVLYRLGYADAQQLRPYSQARWSMPPAQLVRQRVREQLGQRRAVFNAGASVALNRSQNAVLPLLLRMDLEEFSQLFTAPETSVGLIRLRATLVEVTPAGDKLVGQRNVIVQRPAPSSDAPGGVQALTAATDAAIEEIDQWLQQAAAR
ncbi:ABC-type transport auxiliary lipoprotein family protein [Polaromonas sp. YR568]|uniref:ABC-type transport auxiliary lipoprotein family protein n=1 Tax=Polaromonas sp. YR568 TaxID=1855301 RepID=UPI00398BED12